MHVNNDAKNLMDREREIEGDEGKGERRRCDKMDREREIEGDEGKGERRRCDKMDRERER